MTVRSSYATDVRLGVINHARRVGIFETVSGSEPLKAPDVTGIHAAVMEGPGQALPEGSPLNATTVEVTSILHLYRKLALAADSTIDEAFEPELITARDTYLASVMAELTFGLAGVEFNPHGMYGGRRLSWEAAYLDQDGIKYRTQAVTLPVIVFAAIGQTR